jgi:hypothetical protein
VVTREGAPSLGRRSTSLDHVLRDARLSDLETELEQLAMMRGAPHNGFSALTYRVNARSSASICGRPPRERDFQRQYRRKPALCHRTTVICCVLRPGTVPDLYYNEERPHGAIGKSPRLRCSVLGDQCFSQSFSLRASILKSAATSQSFPLFADRSGLMTCSSRWPLAYPKAARPEDRRA